MKMNFPTANLFYKMMQNIWFVFHEHQFLQGLWFVYLFVLHVHCLIFFLLRAKLNHVFMFLYAWEWKILEQCKYKCKCTLASKESSMLTQLCTYKVKLKNNSHSLCIIKTLKYTGAAMRLHIFTYVFTAVGFLLILYLILYQKITLP